MEYLPRVGHGVTCRVGILGKARRDGSLGKSTGSGDTLPHLIPVLPILPMWPLAIHLSILQPSHQWNGDNNRAYLTDCDEDQRVQPWRVLRTVPTQVRLRVWVFCFVLLHIWFLLRTHTFPVLKRTSNNRVRMMENVRLKLHGHFKKR